MLLGQRLDWLFGTCSCTGCENQLTQGEISLSTDLAGQKFSKHLLTNGDALDITFTPRPFGGVDEKDEFNVSSAAPITPRQRDLRDGLQLPRLQTYPVPPNSSPDDSAEERNKKLLQMYQEVALELHTGMYLTQLTADRDYSDIHCQLMEDMTTLKLDQSNGRIIEFPLTNVSKVYRIVKNEDKFYTPGTPVPPERAAKSEQIVVVEFLRRKLAFVFKELHISQRFMICMELLIRRAQQKQAVRSLTPTFPPRQQTSAQGQCPTPRQVYEQVSKGSRSPVGSMPSEKRMSGSSAADRSL